MTPDPTPSSALAAAPAASRTFLGLEWPRDVTRAERQSLIAGGMGWMLDAMDVMLYSLVLTHLIAAFGMDTGTAGFLNSLTLIASAIGGFLVGGTADCHRPARARQAYHPAYLRSRAADRASRNVPS